MMVQNKNLDWFKQLYLDRRDIERQQYTQFKHELCESFEKKNIYYSKRAINVLEEYYYSIIYKINGRTIVKPKYEKVKIGVPIIKTRELYELSSKGMSDKELSKKFKISTDFILKSIRKIRNYKQIL